MGVYIACCVRMDLLGDLPAILNSVVSNSYYGMIRGQMHTNLPLDC